ncbi:hypothetical protein GGR52DRAFT_580448 [Hypoxylon sp. FL1284]|nr:hypothetical protein GGR52DRAFT_580448 [Hypoxylon sp. FL1284]
MAALVPDPDATTPSSLTPPPTTPTVAAKPDPSAPPIKRRAPIACRRCRRMRSKCIHDKAAPCKSCLEANVPEECVFPTRGDMDQDRLFRHPRQRADKKTKGGAKVKRESPSSPVSLHNPLANYRPLKLDNEWELLPGVEAVVDGINTFTRNYYQLGFIPKERFQAQVRENPGSASVFLLLTILAVSSRFSETIIATYGDGLGAATEFMHKAHCLALGELYQQPTLERCQAFYLLSIAEQACGKSNTSYISAGIAFRMAALMRLHREEAYGPISSESPVEHRVRAESARRTFDNLSSGPYKPLSLAPGDITALLPSDEAEFEEGKVPERRAALDGTPPAVRDPSLTSLRPRSLFASLIQAHNLWGIVARRVLLNNRRYAGGGARPPSAADAGAEYARLKRRLLDFEQNLPQEHTFNKIMLSGYKNYAEDRLTGCIRLCHIVLRKEYMEDMIRHAQGNPSNPEVKFYKDMAAELFFNVRKLYSQIEAHYEDGVDIGRVGSQMAGFIIYGCGLLASYLCKFPQLEAHHAGQNLELIQAEGRTMYTRIVSVLRECQKAWPLAETWCNGLEKWYKDPNPKRVSFQLGSMTDGVGPRSICLHHSPLTTLTLSPKKEPQPYVLNAVHPRTTTSGVQSDVVVGFNRSRLTPPATTMTPTTVAVDERGQQQPAVAAKGPEPHRLAPLHQQQLAAAVPQQQQPPHQQGYPHQHPHPQHHQHHQQMYPPAGGLDMLAEASASTPHPHLHSHPHTPHTHHLHPHAPPPQPQAIDTSSSYHPHPHHHQHEQQRHPAYYVDYMGAASAVSSLNDGFDNNLQMLVDGGAAAQWPTGGAAADGTADDDDGAAAADVMYAAYIPSFLPPH